jgi:hypothetical protein
MLTLFCSLAFSTLLSFIAPVLLVGASLTTLFVAGHLPGFSSLGQIGSDRIVGFLSIFGSGYPVRGMFTIAVTFSFVGSLFDLFNYSVYQGARGATGVVGRERVSRMEMSRRRTVLPCSPDSIVSAPSRS